MILHVEVTAVERLVEAVTAPGWYVVTEGQGPGSPHDAWFGPFLTAGAAEQALVALTGEPLTYPHRLVLHDPSKEGS